jgi:hypothetical protein
MTDANFFSKGYTPEDAWEDLVENTNVDEEISVEFLESRKFKTWTKRKAANGDYTCEALGKEWGVHRDTIYKWFKNYPGVIAVPYPATRKKRAYSIITIPAAVAERWRREHTKK